MFSIAQTFMILPSIHPFFLAFLIQGRISGQQPKQVILPTKNKKKNKNFELFIPVHSNKLKKAAEKK